MDKKNPKRLSSLFSIFLTFAVDNLGATIVFPIYSPLFLNPAYQLFPLNFSDFQRSLILGVFFSIFPLLQLIFAPFFGDFSDHKGRKKTLLFTTTITFFGYLISALGVYYRNIYMIFFARVLMGFGSANMTICMSSISDLSTDNKEKLRFYSIGSSIAGMTFIVGPYIGGKLSSPSLSPFLGESFPLFLGATLALINVLFIVFLFKETLLTLLVKEIDPIKSLRTIKEVLSEASTRFLFIIYFFFLFSWNIIFLFLPALLYKQFLFSNAEIGDVCALLGCFWILGTSLINKVANMFFESKTILRGALAFFSIAIFSLLFFKSLATFLVILCLCAVCAGLSWPICTSLISLTVKKSSQGTAMGLSQSALSLTLVVVSVMGGLFLSSYPSAIYTIAFLFSFLAVIFLLRLKRSFT